MRLERSRELRRTATDHERRLWNALRGRKLGGFKWRRQAPIGPYIVDFLCVERRLVVELDGGHHSEQAAYDDRRTVFLERQGLTVLRVWNHAVWEELDAVCDRILAACEAPYPRISTGTDR